MLISSPTLQKSVLGCARSLEEDPLNHQRLPNSPHRRHHKGCHNDNDNDSDNCAHLQSVYAAPGTVLSSLHELPQLILPAD